jgi:hypothetical protein
MNKTLEDIITAQGWNDQTVIWLLRAFIRRQNGSDALLAFARQEAAAENAANNDPADLDEPYDEEGY